MKVYAIGGYNEVGKNMTAVEVGGEVVIFDMGYSMEKIVAMEDEEREASTSTMIEMGAIPDDSVLKGKKVVGIVVNHGHLDHCGAIPKLAEKYGCKIYATPYTHEVIKKLLDDEGKGYMRSLLYPMEAGETVELSQNIQLEFVHITHSIPQTVLSVLHTKEGAVVYANDYKLDDEPTLEKKPDYRRIKALGKEGVKLLISECVRVTEPSITPPERVAKNLVRYALNKAYDYEKSAVIITTFASHIARLRSIIEENKGRRKIVMVGRSLDNYVVPAAQLGLIDASGIRIFGRKRGIKKTMKKVAENPEEYLVICTGNQGEENSVLWRMARKQYEFRIRKDDVVIFASETIPHPINRASKYMVVELLKEQGAKIIDGVHVSGHARREDHRELLKMLSPEYVIPSHGETERLASYAAMALEEGYNNGDTGRILSDGASTVIK